MRNNFEFVSEGFDAFTLVAQDQPDGARLLAEKLQREEAKIAAAKSQTLLPVDADDARQPAACHSDVELLAAVIGGRDAVTAARNVLNEAGSVYGVARLGEDTLRELGIGGAGVVRLASILELARRMVAPREADPMLNRPELIAEFMRSRATGLEIEKFWALCLNRKNRLIRCVEVTVGTAISTLAHPREVFRHAIRAGATAVVCVHNHPSGDPEPSGGDIQMTRQLREASKAVDIDLIDHVILGEAQHDPRGVGFFSFRQAGII